MGVREGRPTSERNHARIHSEMGNLFGKLAAPLISRYAGPYPMNALRSLAAGLVLTGTMWAQAASGPNPADQLPPHIRHLTNFGERADWSADGKKILFLSKTFGDAMELHVASGAIRNLTQHYPHYGYTRAMYLTNGDILLSGPETYDLKNVGQARRNCYLSVLGRDGRKPPAALGVRCNEGPAVSRQRLHLAWAEWSDPKPGAGDLSTSVLFEADIAYTDGVPALSNKRQIIDGAELPFRCTIEPQNFRRPGEQELIFSAYTEGGRKCDVRWASTSNPKPSSSTRIRPTFTTNRKEFSLTASTRWSKCDVQNKLGPGNIDLWKLALDGSGRSTCLTFFSDFPGLQSIKWSGE